MDRQTRNRCTTIYRHQRQRAVAARAQIDYTLGQFRDWVHEQLQRPLCSYCGNVVCSQSWQVDHRSAVARGGGHCLDNLALVCPSCQLIKGVLSDWEFVELLALLAKWPPKANDDIRRRLKSGWKKGWRP